MDKMNAMRGVQEVQMTASEVTKATGDVTSLTVLGMTFAELVPETAALLTIVWMFFRAIEGGIRVYRLLFCKKHDRRKEDSDA